MYITDWFYNVPVCDLLNAEIIGVHITWSLHYVESKSEKQPNFVLILFSIVKLLVLRVNVYDLQIRLDSAN